MPIYGIIERGLRFSRLGSIRKGEQVPVLNDEGKPKKNRAGEIVMRPVERPWFVFSPDMMQAEYVENPNLSKKENKAAEVAHQEAEYAMRHKLLEQIYGLYGTDCITSLNVFLPYPSAHNAFSFWLEAYVANQKVARSDERILIDLFDTETAEVLVKRGKVIRHSSKPGTVAGNLVKEIQIGGEVPYQEGMVVAKSKTKGDEITMKPVGRLNVVIAELRQAATWMVFTGAWADITSIYSAVELIDQISKSLSIPANKIPLILTRVPRDINYETADGTTKKTKKYYIEAKVVSKGVQGLLTSYEDTPYMVQLMDGKADEAEDYDYPEVEAEPIEAEPIEADAGELPGMPPQPAPAPPKPVKRPAKPNSLERPFPPEILKERIRAYVDHFKREGTSHLEGRASQILAAKLNMILGADTERYALCAWLLDKAGSTKSMKATEIAALLEWLEVEKFGDVPSQLAITEARVTMEYVNAAKGQMKADL